MGTTTDAPRKPSTFRSAHLTTVRKESGPRLISHSDHTLPPAHRPPIRAADTDRPTGLELRPASVLRAPSGREDPNLRSWFIHHRSGRRLREEPRVGRALGLRAGPGGERRARWRRPEIAPDRYD